MTQEILLLNLPDYDVKTYIKWNIMWLYWNIQLLKYNKNCLKYTTCEMLTTQLVWSVQVP